MKFLTLTTAALVISCSMFTLSMAAPWAILSIDVSVGEEAMEVGDTITVDMGSSKWRLTRL